MRGFSTGKSSLVSTQTRYAWIQYHKIEPCLHANALIVDSAPENRALSPRKRAMRGFSTIKSSLVSTQTRYAWIQHQKITPCLHANALCVDSASENRALSPRKRAMRGFSTIKSRLVSTQTCYAWIQHRKITPCLHANVLIVRH